jgi:hypothetical protein
MLADAGARGRTDAEFLARFTPELLDLVTGGFATAECEVAISRGRPFEVARVRITERGWRVIDDCVNPGSQARTGVRCWAGSRAALRKREISCSSGRHQMGRPWSRRTVTPFDSHQNQLASEKTENPAICQMTWRRHLRHPVC